MTRSLQCSGSGSTGSTCFWTSRIRILLSSCKNSKKNPDSYYFVTLLVFSGILKVNDENSRIRIQDPDPLVRGMDPPHNCMDPEHWFSPMREPKYCFIVGSRQSYRGNIGVDGDCTLCTVFASVLEWIHHSRGKNNGHLVKKYLFTVLQLEKGW